MTTKKYCNQCGREVTGEPFLRLDGTWENSNWLERYEPYDVILCEDHAALFISETMDPLRYRRWKEDKERATTNTAPCLHEDVKG